MQEQAYEDAGLLSYEYQELESSGDYTPGSVSSRKFGKIPIKPNFIFDLKSTENVSRFMSYQKTCSKVSKTLMQIYLCRQLHHLQLPPLRQLQQPPRPLLQQQQLRRQQLRRQRQLQQSKN